MCDPALQVQTYQGTIIPLLEEADVELGIGDKKRSLCVMIQEEATQDVLLGNDRLEALGGAVQLAGGTLMGSTPPSNQQERAVAVRLLPPTPSTQMQSSSMLEGSHTMREKV